MKIYIFYKTEEYYKKLIEKFQKIFPTGRWTINKYKTTLYRYDDVVIFQKWPLDEYKVRGCKADFIILENGIEIKDTFYLTAIVMFEQDTIFTNYEPAPAGTECENRKLK